MIRFLLAASVAAAHLGCSGQSPLTCVVGQGSWFAKYTLKPNQSVTGLCTQLAGEGLGIRKYFPSGQLPQVDIRTDTLGNLATTPPTDPNLSHVPQSVGTLAADVPDSKGFCSLIGLTPAEQQPPGGPDLIYQWSDVRLVTTANIPGTQMIASLTFTQDNCTAEYKVVAMTPNTDCFMVDQAGNPVLDALNNMVPDPSRCSPANFVNPDFATDCDPALFKCVLTKDPPSVR